MQRILIIADSPSDLNADDIQGKPIWIAPVRISFNGKEHLEFYDIDIREYWKVLSEQEEIPRTAQITPGEWTTLYEKARNEGYTHVLVHTLSATASGIYTSAGAAAMSFMEETGNRMPIVVVDSRSYAFIYGRNVLKCADMVSAGMDFYEICQELRELSRRNRAILWVYTLKHLKKSGRISGMSAFVGESLGIRPALLIRDGHIAPVERVRGNRNIIPKVMELVNRHAVNPREQVMELIYSDAPLEEIRRAEEMLREVVRPKDVVLHEIGCAITTNAGPTSMAVCFYGEPFELVEGALNMQ